MSQGFQPKMRIIHVSGDFPDLIEADKTPVIRGLVDLTAQQFEHRVYSINRRSPAMASFGSSIVGDKGRPALTVRHQPFSYGTAVEYVAPPKGLFHATMLHQLGEWLATTIGKDERPALLVGHKLAIEGIAVRIAAERLDVPYALSIQGNTDAKILAARPDLHRELARVFHGAALIFPFAPWSLKQVEQSLGKRSGPVSLLPCPTDLDTPLVPVSGDGSLLSVFHLKNQRGKNLSGMVAAMDILGKGGRAPILAIVGGGSDAEVRHCKNLIKGTDRIVLEGPLDRIALRKRMNGATGFVLPSLRESFGLVFIEALFAGLPIIYPKGAAVDGYFDDQPFAIRVDARNPQAIAEGMRRMVEEEATLKSALADWQLGDDARRFTRERICRDFSSGLVAAAQH